MGVEYPLPPHSHKHGTRQSSVKGESYPAESPLHRHRREQGRNDTSIRSSPVLTLPLGSTTDRPAPDVPRTNRTSHTSVTEMLRRTETSVSTDPSSETRSVPPRPVRNDGRIFCRAAMSVPLGADRSRSHRATTELAADDSLVTGPALVFGIDCCAQPVKNPRISHAADGALIVASHVV